MSNERMKEKVMTGPSEEQRLVLACMREMGMREAVECSLIFFAISLQGHTDEEVDLSLENFATGVKGVKKIYDREAEDEKKEAKKKEEIINNG